MYIRSCRILTIKSKALRGKAAVKSISTRCSGQTYP